MSIGNRSVGFSFRSAAFFSILITDKDRKKKLLITELTAFDREMKEDKIVVKGLQRLTKQLITTRDQAGR